MRIDILTVCPELLESPLNYSIVKRARDKGLAEINVINLRDFANDKYKSVDDYAFGGGAGMVMMIEPVYRAIEKLKRERNYDEIIYTSPDGQKFDQKTANRLSLLNNIIILAGHYKGIDQRIRDRPGRIDAIIELGLVEETELAIRFLKHFLGSAYREEEHAPVASQLLRQSGSHFREVCIAATMRALEQDRTEVSGEDLLWAHETILTGQAMAAESERYTPTPIHKRAGYFGRKH